MLLYHHMNQYLVLCSSTTLQVHGRDSNRDGTKLDKNLNVHLTRIYHHQSPRPRAPRRPQSFIPSNLSLTPQSHADDLKPQPVAQFGGLFDSLNARVLQSKQTPKQASKQQQQQKIRDKKKHSDV
jgi:hypothetical protein